MRLKMSKNNKPSILLWRDIYDMSDKVAKHFNLRYGKILPETRKLVRFYGEATGCEKCFSSGVPDSEERCKEKILRIRIHQITRPNKPLATSTIVETLAHELAHLREWNHGSAHRRLTKEILEYIREIGYEV